MKKMLNKYRFENFSFLKYRHFNYRNILNRNYIRSTEEE